MRHRKRRTRFGRQSSHRIATLNGLARALFLHQKIKTTHTKAKEARRVVESLITKAKTNSIAARRNVFSILRDETLVKKLFTKIAPLFKNRKGGYTRIIPFNFRKGDGASMVFLELTEKKEEKKPTTKAKHAALKATKAKTKDAKEKPHTTVAPKIDPKVKEEKTVEKVKKEKAQNESRKIEKQKGFMKKMHGFFRRKTNM